MTVLEARNISKIYGGRAGVRHQALDNVNLKVIKGEFVGVMGPSGSGKTTLLNILATIDQPTTGEIEINGTNPNAVKGEALALFRRRNLGFVFQDFNLLDTLTIGENIMLPLVLDKTPLPIIEKRLQDIARTLGITHILDKRPVETSGGEQQRAAAARAIIHQPSLILADEPTGNLDSRSARGLMDCLSKLHESQGATILMVTHDPYVASFCQRIVFIRDGAFYSEIRRGENRQAFFHQVLDMLALLGGAPHDLSAAGLQ